MLQFGKYALIFCAEEFIVRVQEFQNGYPDVSAIAKEVLYTDVLNDYPKVSEEEQKDVFFPFYVKNNIYALQNENL